MSAQIMVEAKFLLSCVLAGVCVTAAYDVLRIFRRVVKHGVFWISIEDIFFWFFAACFLFYVLYMTNNGIIRWYSIAGAGIGMLVYKYTIGEYIVQIMSTILNWVQDVVSSALNVIFSPVKCLFYKGFRKLRRLIKISKKRVKKKLTGNIKKVNIALCKQKNIGKSGD